MRKAKFLIVLTTVVVASSVAFASVVLKHDEASLTRAAHAVVGGQVLDTHSEWNQGHEFLWTYTSVRVEDVAKGEPRVGQIITVREVGGSVGDFNQAMIGAATFTEGERVVLFLERAKDRTPGIYQTVGLSQGKFLISMDAVTAQPLAVSAAHDLHYAGAKRALWDDGPVDLEDFLAAVRQHAGTN